MRKSIWNAEGERNRDGEAASGTKGCRVITEAEIDMPRR